MARKRAKRHTYYWWNKKFKEYKSEYSKLEESGYSERRGYEEITNLKEFKQAYISTTEEIRLTNRKKPSSLSKKLAEDSFFELSRAEARAIKKYFKELKDENIEDDSIEEITTAKIKDIQAGGFNRESAEFYNFIRTERERLFSEGKSAEEVRRSISNVYFGSK